MEKIKVTLVKSTIGCTKKQKDTVAALGLTKIGSSKKTLCLASSLIL